MYKTPDCPFNLSSGGEKRFRAIQLLFLTSMSGHEIHGISALYLNYYIYIFVLLLRMKARFP